MDARELIEHAQRLLEQALAALESVESSAAKPKARAARAAKPAATKIDFSMPFRAFIKRHAGGMSGARKFVLIVAYIAKGDEKVSVDLAEIKRHWNKVTAKGLLGLDFNYKYTSEAKENDWVDATSGAYVLRPAWKEIFQ